MVKGLQMILLCASLIAAEAQRNDFLDSSHRYYKTFDRLPQTELLMEGPVYHPFHREHSAPATYYHLKKRRLLRSDLGKRLFDNQEETSPDDDVTLSSEMEEGGEKRSIENMWKMWQLKESLKKRPMLRGDLGKRQMVRGDLG